MSLKVPANGPRAHSGHNPHFDYPAAPIGAQLHSRLIEIETQVADLELQLAHLIGVLDRLDAVIYPIPYVTPSPSPAPLMQSKDTPGLTYPILCVPPSLSPSPPSPPMQSSDTTCRTYPIIVCLPPAPSPPPPTESKSTTDLTASEIQAQRRAERNEKSRLRMARKRAELKARPWEEQQQAAACSRAHRATYRAKNREALKNAEALRRATLHERKFGEAARAAYEEARRKRAGP